MKDWREVEGLVSDKQCEYLIDTIRSVGAKSVLEIGSYKGKSALAMATVAERVLCIDPFRDYDIGGGCRFFSEYGDPSVDFSENTKDCGQVARLPYLEIVDTRREHWDMFFVDGDHRYSAVVNDYAKCNQLNMNAHFVFHDYGSHEGVTRLVDMLIHNNYYNVLGKLENMIHIKLREE